LVEKFPTVLEKSQVLGGIFLTHAVDLMECETVFLRTSKLSVSLFLFFVVYAFVVVCAFFLIKVGHKFWEKEWIEWNSPQSKLLLRKV